MTAATLLLALHRALDAFALVWVMMASRVETPSARVAWPTALAVLDAGGEVAPLASLVVAVEWHESMFDPSAESATNDHGVMQLNGRHDLCGPAHVYGNVTEGIRMLKASIATCPAHPIAAYAVGPLAGKSERGRRLSREMVTLAGEFGRVASGAAFCDAWHSASAWLASIVAPPLACRTR